MTTKKTEHPTNNLVVSITIEQLLPDEHGHLPMYLHEEVADGELPEGVKFHVLRSYGDGGMLYVKFEDREEEFNIPLRAILEAVISARNMAVDNDNTLTDVADDSTVQEQA